MNVQRKIMAFALSCVFLLGGSLGIYAQAEADTINPTLLVSGLEGGSGSTVGPDGALYVAENAAGRISRIDPETGEVTVFATGLPARLIHTGGIMDIAFIGETAYALVSLVGEVVGGGDLTGIYRIDDENSSTIIADIGQFSVANPSNSIFFVPEGVQYAMEPFGDGFLVTDGHHNRVLQVTLAGDITEVMTFDNIVPTGLEISATSETIYMAEAGPVPHLPEHGKVVSFELGSSEATEVVSGIRLPVAVKFDCCGTLYVLSQGIFEDGNPDGSPAQPNTGALLVVNSDGAVRVLVDDLNLPTSLEFIGDAAYVITLDGEIWQIDAVSG